jgi:predicted transcriptional regulator
MARKPISKEVIDQIVSLRENENLGCRKIAEKLNLSPQTVSKYLKESGCEISHKIPLAVSPVIVEKMRRLKRQGYTLREISEELGYAIPTISFYTSEYVRGRIWNRDNVLALLVDSDFDYAKAAKKINRKKTNVSFLAKKFGLRELVNLVKERIKKQKDINDSKRIKELHQDGLDVNKIAKEIHRSSSFIREVLKGKRLKRKTKKEESNS